MICFFESVSKFEAKMMENYILSYIANSDHIIGKITCTSYMGVVNVMGERAFKSGPLHLFHYTSILLLTGYVDIYDKISEQVIRVNAPSFIDVSVYTQYAELKPSSSFSAYLIVVEQSTFLRITQDMRVLFSSRMDEYVKHPYISVTKQVKRLLAYIHCIIGIVGWEYAAFQQNVLENMLKTFILEIWDIIIDIVPNRMSEQNYRWKSILSQFYYLARKHCREHHSVRWYAKELCVSPDVLAVRIRRTYGRSSNQILDEFLLEEAKVCLLNPAYSIQGVADLLHFSDQASFCRFFKRCSGCTPSEFRKRTSSMNMENANV